jgi:hypothetical protein
MHIHSTVEYKYTDIGIRVEHEAHVVGEYHIDQVSEEQECPQGKLQYQGQTTIIQQWLEK